MTKTSEERLRRIIDTLTRELSASETPLRPEIIDTLNKAIRQKTEGVPRKKAPKRSGKLIHKLNATGLSKLRARGEHATRYNDGGGLYLKVAPKRNADDGDPDPYTRSWVQRFKDGTPRLDKDGTPKRDKRGKVLLKTFEKGIGSLITVGLGDARERSRLIRMQLLDGINPIEADIRRRAEAAVARAQRCTFKQAAEKCIKAKRKAWTNAKHASEWGATLERFVYPVLGDLPVDAITKPLVLKVLEQLEPPREDGQPRRSLWEAIPETMSRVRGRIETVLNYASSHSLRSGENPARWKGCLDHALAKPNALKAPEDERHHAAMPFDRVPAFMTTLRGTPGVKARALEFLVLTAAPAGEAFAARWDEIDLDAKTWTLAASRTKVKREHRVPLSTRAAEIIKGLPRELGSPFIFPGLRSGKKPIDAVSVRMQMRALPERDASTMHGFRSSFRDWAGDATTVQREVIEAALGHVVGDKAEQAYRRSDALEKRRQLMQAWSDYCQHGATKAANVTPLRPRKAKRRAARTIATMGAIPSPGS